MINITVDSFKGGVGKSTVALNFAFELSLKFKVLLIDTDPQNSLAHFLCRDFEIGFSEVITEKVDIRKTIQREVLNKNFDFLPCGILSLRDPQLYEDVLNLENITKLTNIFENYDFIIYDTPPRISKHIETLIDFSDDFLIVLNPDPATFSSFAIFQQFIESRKAKEKTYILINKTEPTKISEDFSKMITYLYKERNLGFIPYDISVLDSQGDCKPTVLHNPTTPFSLYIKNIVEKYLSIKGIRI
ncbi:MAG: ParA family protein [Hydrogenothermaceae bacterium]